MSFTEPHAKILPDTQTCENCHWWAHSRKSKTGECTQGPGRFVTDTEDQGSRTAYERTRATETCDKWQRQI